MRDLARRAATKSAGLTLIELMVSIAILAILVSMAAPSFQTMLMNNRLSAQSDGLVNGLNYARNAALSGNIGTLVCPAGTAGSSVCGSSWAAGWMVFALPKGASDLPLQSATYAANAPVVSTVAVSGSAAASVSFDSRGLAGTAAYFKVCDNRGAGVARSIQVSAAGTVQAAAATSTAPPKAVWGGVLTCP